MIFSSMLNGLVYAITVCSYLHPIHVSVTEIEFDEKDQALEIMMRVFIDDLELSLQNSLGRPELDLLNPKTSAETDALIKTYLTRHFKIALDGKPQKTNYLGHERESEAFIFYIEATNVKKWETIHIQNDIIIATHEDQSNLVHVYVQDHVKSLRLTKNTPADKLTFNNQ